MTFSPLLPTVQRKSSQTGAMPVRGLNLKDDPQFLDTNYAQYILNYYVNGQAKLTRRKGILESIEAEESDEKDVWQEWGDYDVVAYGTDIRMYDRANDTWDTIYTGLTASETHEGVSAGDSYFFVTNKTDGPKRIKYQMQVSFNTNYSGNNVVCFNTDFVNNISVGGSVAGVTSGATGTIVDKGWDDADDTVVVFTVTSGTFINGEQITLTVSGVPTNKTPHSQFNQFSYYANYTPEPTRAVSGVGQTITGQTSGATAEIVYESNGSNSTTVDSFFTLRNVQGTFTVGEDVVGDLDVDSYLGVGGNGLYGRGKVLAVGFVVDELQANTDRVPKAGGVSVVGSRVALFNLTEEQSMTALSAIPTEDATTGYVSAELGDDFRDSSSISGGARMSYTQAGKANTCAQIGNVIVTYCDNGWYGFTISYGDTTKSLTSVNSRIDAGGERGALTTPIGLAVANEAGVTAYYDLGSTDIPYSKQSKLLTASLGEDFFRDVDFTQTDMMYDERREYLYVTCAKNSAQNNLVLAIRAEGSGGSESGAQGAVSLFDWPVKRFLKRSDGNKYALLYDGNLHQLDVGSDDNGAPIHTEYLQELNFGLTDLFNLEECYWKGELSPASSLNVSFDTFDKDMYYQENRIDYPWSASNSYGAPAGWGESGWGSSGWGGGSSSTGLVEDLSGAKPRLRNLSRVRIRFTSDDYVEHVLNWLTASASPVRSNRKRTSPNS